jgi:ABC-type antimicrobial peptide transport system permease subunit
VFQLQYIGRELRRRVGRTILTALGLALGVGLVIGIISVSEGLDDAQRDVLAPLESVGTDLLVTRVVGSRAAGGESATATTVPDPNAPGFFGSGPLAGLNADDAEALLDENRNVITDLAKLGNPGDHFTRDFFLSATLLSFPADAVAKIADIEGVRAAVGGLVQLAEHQTGTVPEIVSEIQTGGETITRTVRPRSMTPQERTAFRRCLAEKGVRVTPSTGTRVSRQNPAFDECLPARFREQRVRITTPLQTIRSVLDPPSTDIASQSYTAAGIDPGQSDFGLVTRAQLSAGDWLAEGATDQLLLNVAYANEKNLGVGSTVPINGIEYRVVGLVRPTLTGSVADLYFPLETLQKLAAKEGRVTQVLVQASDAGRVDEVAAEIRDLVPGAEVITTEELAEQVTGSLADAEQLANRLGGALAAIVLLAAFALAAVLTLSSIGKRVREIGTLRAIGWSRGRVVRQLLGETVGIGVLGGVLGVAAGIGAAAGAHALSPALNATTSGVPGLNTSQLATLFGQAADASHTTTVELTAPIEATTLLVGVGFAVLGGVLAGLIGGWRAARLTPVVALRDLG